MKITACLNRGAVVQAFENPMMVIAISELDQRGAELVEIAEAADPE